MVGHLLRPARRALSRTPLDRRPAVGRATPLQPRRQAGAGRQRRDLQPPRTAARAGRRVRLPHRFGLRGDPPALPQIRRGAARPAQRHLRLRALRHRARRVSHRPRPHRRHSALHRLGCRRTVLRRIGVEGARRGVQRHPPLRAGALPVEPRGEDDALVHARLVRLRSRRAGRRRPCRAALGARSGRPTAANVRRSLRRAAVGRTRFVDHLGRSQTLRRPPHRDRRTRRCVVALPPLVRRRPERRSRPPCRTQGRRPHRYGAPRNPLHRPGGARRPARRDLPHRNLRRDDRARLDADVPAGARHQVDGHQDGALGRGCRRGFRRLPLFPQGARRPCLPRGDRAQDQ